MDVEIDAFADDPGYVGNTPQSVVEDLGAVTLAYAPLALPGLEMRLGARYRGRELGR